MARRAQTYAIRLAVEGGGQVKAELVSVGQSGEQSLKRIETGGERAFGGLKGLGRQAELLRTGIRTLGGALIGAATVGGLGALIDRSISAADAIGKTADKIGVGVEALQDQFDAKGLMVKTGTLIDASLVEADCRRPRKGEPVEGRSDRDASWNAMPEQPLFGYKMHLAVDQGSGLVRQALLTPGHVSDKVPFLDLVQGDEEAVYADKGYDGAWYRARLLEQGIADGVMAGDYRQRLLDAAGHARNRAIGAIRASVERTFALLKRWYGYGRVRYRSLVKNALQLQLLAVALNLRRALVLSA